MKEKLKVLYRRILMILPAKLVLHFENFRGYHRFGNFKNPRYFGEKIQWLKLNGNLEKYTNLVDKYLVRDYIEENVDKGLVIPLLGVYDKTSEIDFNSLPDKFVIKINNGSGFNIIVKNKSEIDRKEICKTLDKWMSIDYYKIKKEPQYKHVKKKILIEKFIADEKGELLDYKFFCFNGEPKFVEVDFDRFENHKMNFYDLDWNLLKLKKGKNENYTGNVVKPKNFDKMTNYAKMLCKDFGFVRVDLYNVDGTIYFGELTFTPASGLTAFSPIEKDFEIANAIKVDDYRRVMFLGSIGFKTNRLDGVTVKSLCLYEYLLQQKIFLKMIDVDNYRKNIVPILFQFIVSYFKSEKIVICSSSPGASKIIKILNFIKTKKDVYYFVCGGSLDKAMEDKKYNVDWYRFIKRIYVESDSMRDNFLKFGLTQTVKVNNFRDPKIEFQAASHTSGTVKFVFFGRVIKEKGVEEAIKLIKKLRGENCNVSLDIYGQCRESYLSTIQNIIGDEKGIKYLGSIEPNGKKEYNILHEYDIFIFPTEHEGEGLPGALIDSYISGLAVVASNWKYAKEYIDESNGVIFNYKDYNDMYDKTKKLLNSGRIEDLKNNSLKKSKDFIVNYILKDFSKELEK